MSKLLVLFNHILTEEQKKQAFNELHINEIVSAPSGVQKLWSSIPPEVSVLDGYLKPVLNWISSDSMVGDVILVQGDYGATYYVVRFALKQGLRAVYATTARDVQEKVLPSGEIAISRNFRHVIFREYESSVDDF